MNNTHLNTSLEHSINSTGPWKLMLTKRELLIILKIMRMNKIAVLLVLTPESLDRSLLQCSEQSTQLQEEFSTKKGFFPACSQTEICV